MTGLVHGQRLHVAVPVGGDRRRDICRHARSLQDVILVLILNDVEAFNRAVMPEHRHDRNLALERHERFEYLRLHAEFLEHRGIARLGIQQDSLYHGLHVATHTAAIVRKGSGHAGDVVRAWIGGDQSLDQLPANKWTYVRMYEQIANCKVHVGKTGGASVT